VWRVDETEQYDPKAKTGGLFTDYVNIFLKMKQEASGWPECCQSENDKWRYIRLPLKVGNTPGLQEHKE
jgi:hypothetical protein